LALQVKPCSLLFFKIKKRPNGRKILPEIYGFLIVATAYPDPGTGAGRDQVVSVAVLAATGARVPA
jgi:hypothetical protein